MRSREYEMEQMDMGEYRKLFDGIHTELSDYFFRWYFDRPFAVTPQRDGELGRISDLLHRFLQFYAGHYREYLDIIPYEDRVLRYLEMQEAYGPYRAGTARIDYIIGDDGGIRVCEITSRFFGNGYFLSFFADKKGRELAEEITGREAYEPDGSARGLAGMFPETAAGDAADGAASPPGLRMESLLAAFADLAADRDQIFVLISADRSDSIRLYVPFYRALGKEVTVLEADEVPDAARSGAFEKSLVLSALNQRDLLAMPDDVIRRIIDAGQYNDFRSVFLAHDKRVLSLLFSDSVTDRIFTPEETGFIRRHVIPTYLFGEHEEKWADARRARNGYILKHRALGKSEMVYAGCMTQKEEWERLFEDSPDREAPVRGMILQPFIRQREIPNTWEGKAYTEYVSGTILLFDGKYYGTGLFRSSSLPVLNKGDDRKAGYVVTGDTDAFGGRVLLL